MMIDKKDINYLSDLINVDVEEINDYADKFEYEKYQLGEIIDQAKVMPSKIRFLKSGQVRIRVFAKNIFRKFEYVTFWISSDGGTNQNPDAYMATLPWGNYKQT